MNKRDEAIFKHLMERYKFHWDHNQYYRTEHDHCLEYYRGKASSSGFPLVYKESFNRILPIIYTILSRFMDQLFQSPDVVSVDPPEESNWNVPVPDQFPDKVFGDPSSANLIRHAPKLFIAVGLPCSKSNRNRSFAVELKVQLFGVTIGSEIDAMRAVPSSWCVVPVS